MKVPLVFPAPQSVNGAAPVLFSAWISAPMNLEVGDELEIDLPADLLDDSIEETEGQTARATGRITAMAVHTDGRLWYQFAAALLVPLPVLPSETIPKYLSLSIIP